MPHEVSKRRSVLSLFREAVGIRRANDVECPSCDGDGKVHGEKGEVTCPQCGGSGSLSRMNPNHGEGGRFGEGSGAKMPKPKSGDDLHDHMRQFHGALHESLSGRGKYGQLTPAPTNSLRAMHEEYHRSPGVDHTH